MSSGGRAKDPVRKCFEEGADVPAGRVTPVLLCKGCGEGVSAVVILQGELHGRLQSKQVTLSIDGWTAPGQQHTLWGGHRQ